MEQMGCREVSFLLPVVVVYIDFFGIIAQVFGVVVSVFGIDEQFISAEVVLPAALCKEISIPLTFTMSLYVVEYRTGNTSLRVIIIGFGIPFAVWRRSEKSTFDAQ